MNIWIYHPSRQPMLSILVMLAVSWCWVFTRPCCGTRRRRPSCRSCIFLCSCWRLRCISCHLEPYLSFHLSFLAFVLSLSSPNFSSPLGALLQTLFLSSLLPGGKNRLPVSLCPKGLGTKTLFLVPSFLLFLDCYSGFLFPFSLTSFQDPWWRGRWIKRQVSLQTLILIISDNIW